MLVGTSKLTGFQRRCALVLLGLAGGVPLQGAAAQPPTKPPPAPPIPLANADAFTTRRTDRFLIWYDTSYEVLRPLVNRLEGTYDAVVRVGRHYGFAMEDPAEPLCIVLVESHDDYAVLARRALVDAAGAAGFYHPGDNVSIFGDVQNSPALSAISKQIKRLQARIERSRGRGRRGASANARAVALGRDLSRLLLQRDAIVERFNRLVIQHEAAHQIFFNLGVHGREADCPTWLVEGLATQFEVPQSSAQKGLHRANQMRLADLRSSAGIGARVKKVSDAAYATAFGTGRLVPLVELIRDDGVFAGDGQHVTTVYAQAWSLVYFLARTNPEGFSGYLAQVAVRPSRERVEPQQELKRFTEFFGPVDDGFQREWLKHVVRLRFDPAAD